VSANPKLNATRLFGAIDMALPDLTGDEAQEVVQCLLSRLGLAALRLGVRDDALLLPEEAAALARVPVRRIRSWARATHADSWAVWTSERGLRVREGPFRRALVKRHEQLTKVKARHRRILRLRRADKA
jgi:hypothetical protein